MARWLCDPRLLEWYHGRDNAFDVAKVAERYGPRVRGEDGFVASIIDLDGRAIGSYEKTGFRKVRVLCSHEMHEGVRHDAWLLSLEKLR